MIVVGGVFTMSCEKKPESRGGATQEEVAQTPSPASPGTALPATAPSAATSKAIPKALGPALVAVDGRPFHGPRYAIKYPDGWEQRHGAMGAHSLALAPLDGKGDNFRENVNVVLENVPTTDTDEIWKRTEVQLQRMLTGYARVDKRTAKLAGTDAVVADYKHQQGIFKLKVRVALIAADKGSYIVTCSAKEDAFDQYAPTFDKVIKTFSLARKARP